MNCLNIEAICFDYYGTLVNAGKPFEKIKDWFNTLLLEASYNISIEQFNIYFSKQRAKMITCSEFITGYEVLKNSYINTCIKFNLQPKIEGFKSFIADLFISPVAFDDVYETLSILKQKYIIGLITNADNELLTESIKRQGFKFDFVISSEDAKCNKPQLNIFKIANDRINLSTNKILMVGDSLAEDIIPAQSLGFNTVWINRNNEKLIINSIEIKKINELLVYL